MKISDALIVYTIPRTKEQKSAFDKVLGILNKYKIEYNLANRDKLTSAQFQNRDLVIAVGGDGTFLRAAQFINSQLLFGVNSDCSNKEGFFMKSNKKDFDAKINKMIHGKFKIRKLPRLEAYINNEKIETLALNEFFIGPRKSYHAAKYIIKIGDTRERQKSSGILITTPAGSYAWASACSFKRLPLESGNYQLVVREPYEGKLFKNYKLKYLQLNKNEKVSVISEMLDGIIIADSVGKEHGLKNGGKAEIRMSNKPLNAIWFK